MRRDGCDASKRARLAGWSDHSAGSSNQNDIHPVETLNQGGELRDAMDI